MKSYFNCKTFCDRSDSGRWDHAWGAPRVLNRHLKCCSTPSNIPPKYQLYQSDASDHSKTLDGQLNQRKKEDKGHLQTICTTSSVNVIDKLSSNWHFVTEKTHQGKATYTQAKSLARNPFAIQIVNIDC